MTKSIIVNSTKYFFHSKTQKTISIIPFFKSIVFLQSFGFVMVINDIPNGDILTQIPLLPIYLFNYFN